MTSFFNKILLYFFKIKKITKKPSKNFTNAHKLKSFSLSLKIRIPWPRTEIVKPKPNIFSSTMVYRLYNSEAFFSHYFMRIWFFGRITILRENVLQDIKEKILLSPTLYPTVASEKLKFFIGKIMIFEIGSTFYLPYVEGPGGKKMHNNLLSPFSCWFLVTLTQIVNCS